MSSDEEQQFEATDSGASDRYPMQCSALRKNGFVVIKDHPCKVVDMSTSKTGKHGHAKVHLVGIDIFTGRKYEELCPSTHNMMVPNVKRQDYQLSNIDDEGFASLMNPDDGSTREDLKIPEGELGEEIKAKFAAGEDLLLSVLAALGEEAIMGHKPNNK